MRRKLGVGKKSKPGDLISKMHSLKGMPKKHKFGNMAAERSNMMRGFSNAASKVGTKPSLALRQAPSMTGKNFNPQFKKHKCMLKHAHTKSC